MRRRESSQGPRSTRLICSDEISPPSPQSSTPAADPPVRTQPIRAMEHEPGSRWRRFDPGSPPSVFHSLSNSSELIPAWRRMLRKVPRAISRCFGTIAVRVPAAERLANLM